MQVSISQPEFMVNFPNQACMMMVCIMMVLQMMETELGGEQVYRAVSQFHQTRVATVQACSAFDYVLSPTSPVPAFAAELPSPTNDPLRPLEHIGFTVPFNMSEQPAASINCGYTADGLPIGLQIVGARFDDLGVLQVARAFELLRPPQRAWPQPA